MCRIIIMLSLLGCFPNNAQQKTINVDSLFAKSINDLKIIANESISHDLKDRNLIEFMWIISLIGNKDFVNPHQTIHINKKIVSEIEQWYIANKQYITSSNIEKAKPTADPINTYSYTFFTADRKMISVRRIIRNFASSSGSPARDRRR